MEDLLMVKKRRCRSLILPATIIESTSLESFKNKIFDHLFNLDI
ncbi:GSCOCG00001499001-RA-CDS [Cotesia congregata]|nr:GSCOCG00001499001-RA-CDS [Cotesia congregata]